MNTLLVSYDLIAPGKDYSRLWEHLKSYQGYAKPLESVWLMRTNYDADYVKKIIRDNFMDRNDKILIINVTGDAASWNNLGESMDQWIKNHL